MAVKDETEYVYFARSVLNKEIIKIGRSKNPWWRTQELKTTLLAIVACRDSVAASDFERKLHNHFDYVRVNGEYFRAMPVETLLNDYDAENPKCSGYKRVLRDKTAHGTRCKEDIEPWPGDLRGAA